MKGFLPPLKKGDRGGFDGGVFEHPSQIPPSPPFSKGGTMQTYEDMT